MQLFNQVRPDSRVIKVLIYIYRSNMERHGKHQHPTVWQRSPSNRVINRQKNQQNNPLVGPPTLVPNKFNAASLSLSLGGGSGGDKLDGGPNNANIRAMIAQQLKRKLSNSSLRNAGSENEGDFDGSENGKISVTTTGSGDELASVERLLDRVNKSSNFAQYFTEDNGVAENLTSGDHPEEDEDEEEDDVDVLKIKEEEDEEGRMRGSVASSVAEESGEEEDEEEEDEEEDCKLSNAAGGVEKKKSAYSSAPHKVSGDFLTAIHHYFN